MDMMTPYIATTSQKMMEIRFLVRILGALTPPPRMEEPVMKIPLRDWLSVFDTLGRCTVVHTMLLRQLIARCKNRCLDLPRRMAIRSL